MKTSKPPIPSCLVVLVFLFLLSMFACGLLGQYSSKKSLVTECDITETREKVRLYQYHGSSVTSSDSWVVTFQVPGLRETKIFGAYSSPGIKNIECQVDQVVFVFYPDHPIPIPLTWIKNELIYKPLSFNKGLLNSVEYEEEVSTWKGVYP